MEKATECVYKWRENNPERYKEIQKKAVEKYVETHREKKNEIQRNYYQRNKEEINRKARERRALLKQQKENSDKIL